MGAIKSAPTDRVRAYANLQTRRRSYLSVAAAEKIVPKHNGNEEEREMADGGLAVTSAATP